RLAEEPAAVVADVLVAVHDQRAGAAERVGAGGAGVLPEVERVGHPGPGRVRVRAAGLIKHTGAGRADAFGTADGQRPTAQGVRAVATGVVSNVKAVKGAARGVVGVRATGLGEGAGPAGADPLHAVDGQGAGAGQVVCAGGAAAESDRQDRRGVG